MIHEVLEGVILFVDGVGVIIMMLGFVLALWQFAPVLFRNTINEEIAEIQKIRCRLGSYLVLALEFMIVSDLLHSVMSRQLEDLYFLGALVALRTLIGYFLNKEIHEIGERVGH